MGRRQFWNQRAKVPAKGTPSNPEHSDPVSTEEADFRRDARIWSLYLEEATEEAKDQAEMWKTGLESLLVFAGLFAGVVGSFLVDSRQKLRLGDQEALLIDIRSALLNETSPAEGYQPSIDVLWINGLWSASLLITLFSAIMGVLARSWLVKYAPLKVGREATDAHRRWMLDKRTKKWRMERIVTLVPLLVQLAFLLFALGLGIQLFFDNQILGIVILTVVLLGALVYIFITLLPLFLPPGSSPFDTPLSDILYGLKTRCQKLLSFAAPQLPVAATQLISNRVTDILVEKIWYTKLIKSHKANHVDEAVAELTRKDLEPERWDFFADSETPAICLRRLRQCIDPGQPKQSNQTETLRIHLKALSQFVAQLENHERKQPSNLTIPLFHSLGPGQVLHSWSVFPEAVRPLAFSVRVPILLEFKQDLLDTEVEDKPWETMTDDLRDDRLRFMLATCRGLKQGQQNLRWVSSSAISVCLINAAKSGKSSEWGSHVQSFQAQAMTVGKQYLILLFREIANQWEELDIDPRGSKVLSARATKMFRGAGFGESLSAALSHPFLDYRRQAFAIISAISERDDAVYYLPAVLKSIPRLMDMAILEWDEALGPLAADVIHSISTNPIFRAELYTSINALLHEQLQYGMKAQGEIIRLVLRLAGSHTFFFEAFTSSIPGLLKAALYHMDETVRSLALDLLQKVAVNDTMHRYLETAVLSRMSISVDTKHDLANRQQALNTLALMLLPPTSPCSPWKFASFIEKVVTTIDQFLPLSMNDSEAHVRKFALDAFEILLNYHYDGVETRKVVVQKITVTLVDALTSPNTNVRLDIIRTLQDNIRPAGKQDMPRDLVDQCLPQLLKISFDDSDSQIRSPTSDDDPSSRVRLAALYLLLGLASIPRYQPSLNKVLDITNFTWRTNLNAQHRTIVVQILINLAIASNSRDGLDVVILFATRDDDILVRQTSAESILSSSTTSEWLKDTLLSIVGQLGTDEFQSRRYVWLSLLVVLLQNGRMRDRICEIILRHVFTLSEKGAPFKDKKVFERDSQTILSLEAINMLAKSQDHQIRQIFAQYLPTFYQGSGPLTMIDQLVELAFDDPQYDVRCQSIKSLGELGKKGEVARLVAEVISPRLNSLLSDRGPSSLTLPTETEQGTADDLSNMDVEDNGDEDEITPWIQTLKILVSSGGFKLGLSLLVDLALGAGTDDIRLVALEALNGLASSPQEAESIFADPIFYSGLSESLKIALYSNTPPVREAWGHLVATLCQRGIWLIDRPGLVDLAVMDGDLPVRSIAIDCLAPLIAKDAQIAAALRATLHEELEHSLLEHRIRAIKTSQLIVDHVRHEEFYGVLKALSLRLLAMMTTEETGVARNAIESLLGSLIEIDTDDLCMTLLRGVQGTIPHDTQARRSVIADQIAFTDPDQAPASHIPPWNVPISSLVRRVLGKLLSQDRMSDLQGMDIVFIFATLTQALKGEIGEVQVETYNLMAILLEEFEFKVPIEADYTRELIPQILLAIFDGKSIKIRATAINLLTGLCKSDSAHAASILDFFPRFVGLLELNETKWSAVLLLSSMARDPGVRTKLTSWIVSSNSSKDPTPNNGSIDVLVKLVYDGRLNDRPQASDYSLLLLASSIALEPTMPLRLPLLYGLRTKYSALLEDTESAAGAVLQPTQPMTGLGSPPDELVRSFMLALFGRHVTLPEVKSWLEMEKYLNP